MKYFITENGLEPFDLTAKELLTVLRNNIKPVDTEYTEPNNNKTAIPYSGNGQEAYDKVNQLIQELIDSPNCVFKHPEYSKESFQSVVSAVAVGELNIETIKGFHKYVKSNQKTFVICSIASYDYKTVHYGELPNERRASMLRQITIDEILKELD